ncbi:hypothetical protein F7725_028122 [Dissostichus mawsoni]|uniref:Uncharacterized protein n=1 Tax=Dissostichus mawsoni TaxID=36200 RepID=A0A7J5XEZ7_DISMA|nr:hypothetical protein F7725_028122 [Dissostichus mawsoni]
MRIPKEQDPDNLCLAVYYLFQRAMRGERIEDEARELATKVLRSPVSSYSGLKPLLWVYRKYISVDKAIDLAEKALKNHPDVRYLKRRAALCYYDKMFYCSESPPKKSMLDRAISLHQEVIALYPDSSLMKKICLANIYALSHDGQAKAEQIYQELIENDLEPVQKQLLYNNYAKHLFFKQHNLNMSIRYHMKAAAIPHQSVFRKKSIKELEKTRDKGSDRMCGEIREFLANLAAQTMLSRLKALQCHFTWDLGLSSADEGPWLVVNYGNLAWLHHSLGNQAESEAYLYKIDALNKKYPSPSQEELHPETYAEKAYALMTSHRDAARHTRVEH